MIEEVVSGTKVADTKFLCCIN